MLQYIVTCNHVLEHIIDDHLAMSELYRVLRPNGWAILQVPISNLLEKTYEDFSITDTKGREEHFGQFDHVRIYGKDYPEKLKSAGFNVELIKPNGYLSDKKSFNYHAVNPEETLYIAHKS